MEVPDPLDGKRIWGHDTAVWRAPRQASPAFALPPLSSLPCSARNYSYRTLWGAKPRCFDPEGNPLDLWVDYGDFLICTGCQSAVWLRPTVHLVEGCELVACLGFGWHRVTRQDEKRFRSFFDAIHQHVMGVIDTEWLASKLGLPDATPQDITVEVKIIPRLLIGDVIPDWALWIVVDDAAIRGERQTYFLCYRRRARPIPESLRPWLAARRNLEFGHPVDWEAIYPPERVYF
jgi:hypothetical protein